MGWDEMRKRKEEREDKKWDGTEMVAPSYWLPVLTATPNKARVQSSQEESCAVAPTHIRPQRSAARHATHPQRKSKPERATMACLLYSDF